ncbi:SPOR domain-containing protein [Lonsdalea quercina]|uniref:SPOR domain-containing protein n=1 Tax=Lonsdalea quercina TaxID=71657 RepID=UPI003976C771
MGEFNPEDELKPDTSDRRPQRQQKRKQGFTLPNVALSKQHVMIGIGIIVLVLLIVAVGAALQSPSQDATPPAASSGGSKSIELASPSASTTGSTAAASPQAQVPGQTPTGEPQSLSAPPVAEAPTQAPLPAQNKNQQRIELPGNMMDTLSQPQQQQQLNAVAQNSAGSEVTLPTSPASVSPGSKVRPPRETTTPLRPGTEKSRHTDANGSSHKAPEKNSSVSKAPTPAITPAPSGKSVASAGGAQANGSIQNAPASHFTLQLSGASRESSLQAYAKSQRLTNYWVYQTQRGGKPWYVLVSGVYASSDEAKRAVATLPADVQAKKPWVKPIRQVKQDLSK